MTQGLDIWLEIEYINTELMDLEMWNLGILNSSSPQFLNQELLIIGA